MASMISYFGHIYTRERTKEEEQQPSSKFCWDGRIDFGSNLVRLGCPYGQLKFLLEQELAAAYYVKFYGLRCHEMISDFITELNNDVCYRFTRTCGKEFKDNFQKMFGVLNGLVKFTRGGNWTDVDIPLVKEFLFDSGDRYDLPVVWSDDSKNGLIAFLIWMNKGVHPELTSIAGNCCVTTFDLQNQYYGDSSAKMVIAPCHHRIGRSFSAEKTTLDQLTVLPILGILSHYDLATIAFESLIAVISRFCLHTDIERYGLSMTHHLAYCLKRGVLYPTFSIAGCEDGIEPIRSRYHDVLFNALIAFLGYCTKNRGMKVVDRNVVARAFGCVAYTKEQKESADYLRKCDATVSADELQSFQKIMGSIESMQLISQNPTLDSAQSSQVTSSTEEAGASTGDGGNKTEPDEGKGDDEAKPKEGDEGKEDDDSDADGADDFGADDDSADTGTDAGSQDDTGTDTGDASSDAGNSDTSPSSTQTGGAQPEDIHASDDKGIVFKVTLPESSTVDTVLFREEMDKFLTNVLTNPPKCMSPQDVQTLTALKRFWLHYLSVETIVGIVEACIRLPKSLKHSIHKSTEL